MGCAGSFVDPFEALSVVWTRSITSDVITDAVFVGTGDFF